MIINYDRTWCDYLTPCKVFNKENNTSGIFVGDYDCSKCQYFGGHKLIQSIDCKYNEE